MIRNTLNLAPKTDQKLMSVFEDLHYGRSCLRINVFRRYLVKPTLVQSPKKARRLFIIIIICQHKCIIHSEKENQIYTYNKYTSECTVVGLSTRPAPLIISKCLQFWILWSQSKALFMIRCMSSVGSGSETFGALKVTIYVKFFELSVHKMSNFLRISACQWTIPSGLFAKKKSLKIFL